MKKVRLIANYLPQYHRIPENDKWWGEGFTDWEAVRKAKVLYSGHNQPRTPLNYNYYDLSNKDAIKWQAEVAKQYGIYGFAIYHYWFSEEMNLLHKPAEIILNNNDIDINYMFLWDNCSWKRTWSNVQNANAWLQTDELIKCDSATENTNGLLAELKYGNKRDWEDHFNYLLPFFRDERYIKVDGKPVFGFFQPENEFETIYNMKEHWTKLAIEHGFPGLICMTRDNIKNINFETRFRYTPFVPVSQDERIYLSIKNKFCNTTNIIRKYDYDKIWRHIIKDAHKSDSNTILSGLVQFDDTPRRGKRGRIVENSNPQKFENYLRKLVSIADQKDQNYVFLTAWNEWGEGAYLEPDSENGYAYLEACQRVMTE